MKKHTIFAAVSACILAALATAATAAEPDSVSVIADGYPYSGMVEVYNDTAYVSLREFSAAMDGRADGCGVGKWAIHRSKRQTPVVRIRYIHDGRRRNARTAHDHLQGVRL